MFYTARLTFQAPGETRMIKSRAAVAFEAKKPLEIVEVDVAMPKAGEVLLRVVASGVCHTDAYTHVGTSQRRL